LYEVKQIVVTVGSQVPWFFRGGLGPGQSRSSFIWPETLPVTLGSSFWGSSLSKTLWELKFLGRHVFITSHRHCYFEYWKVLSGFLLSQKIFQFSLKESERALPSKLKEEEIIYWGEVIPTLFPDHQEPFLSDEFPRHVQKNKYEKSWNILFIGSPKQHQVQSHENIQLKKTIIHPMVQQSDHFLAIRREDPNKAKTKGKDPEILVQAFYEGIYPLSCHRQAKITSIYGRKRFFIGQSFLENYTSMVFWSFRFFFSVFPWGSQNSNELRPNCLSET